MGNNDRRSSKTYNVVLSMGLPIGGKEDVI
jgi:hypothetical protein